MGTNECSQPASKSSWDSQDFGDVNLVLKMARFHKSSRPRWVNQSHFLWYNLNMPPTDIGVSIQRYNLTSKAIPIIKIKRLFFIMEFCMPKKITVILKQGTTTRSYLERETDYLCCSDVWPDVSFKPDVHWVTGCMRLYSVLRGQQRHATYCDTSQC